MERNFQYADLSRMESTPMCAVICRTAEEAEEFFYNVRSQFPDHLYWSLDNLMGLWKYHGPQTGFTFFCEDDTEPGALSYCDEPWFKETGYVLIEFSELCNTPDFEDSNLPLEFLLS